MDFTGRWEQSPNPMPGHLETHAANDFPAMGTTDTDSDATQVAADGGFSWFNLSGFQRDLIKAIIKIDRTGGKPSGLNVKRRLEERYDVKINHGRLYPNLDALVDMSLVEKGDIDRRTKSYRPTDSATELVRRELQADVDIFEEDRQ